MGSSGWRLVQGETDYYRILGVKPRASQEEIRRRWIELNRRLHPDRGEQGAAGSQKLKAINEAYAILRHSSTRMRYDLKRAYERKKRREARRKGMVRIGFLAIVMVLGVML